MTQEKFIELSEREFKHHYPLLTNHINPHSSWTSGDNNGCLFETHGLELVFVKSQPTNRIWTIIDGEDNHLYLLSGFHFANRIGYLISTKPSPDNTMIQVRVR